MSVKDEEYAIIKRLISFFSSDESLQKENKNILKEAVKTFRQCTAEVGLSQVQIHTVAEIVANHKFGEMVSSGLIYSLLPQESVADDTFLMVISKICADMQSLKIKALLLRWMVLVFDLISLKSRCHCVYGFLFHYIHNDSLCPHVCHLLYLLTRKCDVTHYRIARLLELQRKVGSQPHISGLLSLFRMYHPSLISMSGRYRRFFKSDKVWEKSIVKVQQRYGLNLPNETLFHAAKQIIKPELKQAAKLIRTPSLSMAHDESATDQPLSSVLSGKIPVHQIKSFHELLNHIGQLEITSQAYTLLSSKTLQHVIAITPDKTVSLRLSFWLHHCLQTEILSKNEETDRGKELLSATIEISSLMQECLPVCEKFLFRYLWTWNGSDYRMYILSLISKLRLMPFPELQQKILTSLHKLYTLSLHVYFKCSIIGCLTDLLTNYVSAETDRFELMREADDEFSKMRFLLFPQSYDEVDADETISGLVQFVDDLYSISFRTVDKPLLLLHYVLQFHHQVSTIYLHQKKPLSLLPSTQIFFQSLITLSAPCIALILRILSNHIQTAAAMKEKGIVISRFRKMSNLLNRYCVDAFDALWRRRSFHPLCQEETLIFPDFDLSLLHPIFTYPDELSLTRMFGIDRHPALISFTIQYLRVSKKDFSEVDAAEFVLDSSFVEFLQSNGLKDVTTFIQMLRED